MLSDFRFEKNIIIYFETFILVLGAGSSAIDFTQLGHQKCFGTKQKTKFANSIAVFL